MRLAVTRSSWINAWTLQQGCRALGVGFRVDGGPRELPLPTLRPGEKADWLLFTEEASLRAALEQNVAGAYLPRRFPADLLDDKWAFGRFLEADEAGPRPLPQWPLHAPPPPGANWPLLLKARHSWVGTRKLPRGWVCRSRAELTQRLQALAEQGLEPSWFFLQRWFGDEPMRLLSVAGFFDADDPGRNLACVTERLQDYGAGPSSSALLATVDDRLGLVDTAARLLRRLDYRGPYELEFVVVPGGVHVLELNPRFWMQHGLFVAHGNGLLKRYFGLDGVEDRTDRVLPAGLLWADGFWLLRRLLRGDVATWRRLRGARAVICPAPAAVLHALLWRALGGPGWKR